MAERKGPKAIPNEKLLKELLDAYVEAEDDRPDAAAYAQENMARFRRLRRKVLMRMRKR